MFEYEPSAPEEFMPIITINLEVQDPTNMKLLFDSLHQKAFMLGLSEGDFEEEYKIEVENINGYEYLALSISIGYYQFLLEKEKAVSFNMLDSNPGVFNLQ